MATAVADVKSYLQANELEAVDAEVLKAKTETLRQAAYKLAEEMYKNAQGGASEGGAGARPGANALPRMPTELARTAVPPPPARVRR